MRTMLGVTLGLSILGLVGSAPAAESSPLARVRDLAWISGQWEGPAEDGVVVEEHWMTPRAGSVGALVRITKGGATIMTEMVLIEEESGSLVLHLRQWGAGLTDHAHNSMTMKLTALSKKSVKFEVLGEGSLQSLSYRRDGSRLLISAIASDGRPIKIPLRRN